MFSDVKPRRAVGRFLHTEWGHFKDIVSEVWTWAKTNNWKKTARQVFARKYWGWWILVISIAVLSAVLSSYHDQIIHAVHPYVKSIRQAKWSWTIPVILLIIVSFPPLFGHELLILVVGLIWGLGLGFVIACAGTFLGEVAVFFACKHWLRERAQRIESKSLTYACLARLLRDGGLYMVTLVRFSAMPGHITTAMQSTVGISFFIYCVACVITLPKQFSLVYIGVVFSKIENFNPDDPANLDPLDPNDPDPHDLDAKSRHRQKMISFIVFAATTLATVIAAYVIYRNIRLVRDDVRKCMQAKQAELGILPVQDEKSTEQTAARRSIVGAQDESDSDSDEEGAGMGEKRRAASFGGWHPHLGHGRHISMFEPRVRSVSADEGERSDRRVVGRTVEVVVANGTTSAASQLWREPPPLAEQPPRPKSTPPGSPSLEADRYAPQEVIDLISLGSTTAAAPESGNTKLHHRAPSHT